MTKEEKVKKLKERGCEEVWIDDFDVLHYMDGNPDDIFTTEWEEDLETGATRHRGRGEGCFWTNWEGGIE